ncbi:HEAT repeat domain-containing protein [Flavobacterium sp. MAH-1]|uniref:HEAT repeat domain-containing protein n=1 Tax=Flavobacterium agri TaxID=2743471 RepID=A0A7Y8Y2E4_9FLAO|nr:HEAT repeat domain-containing protein [Flavobacterium agri]NUY81310.1 HEAT repeat domain-containing protein [Flavobacterium agri]NYA71334.1 HEAT repeat domain-containing protein [Flavobacterium agri]
MKRFQHLIISLFLIASMNAKADSWIDPTWRKMLDNSDVVALVEYVSSGDFNAKAKIVSMYKGALKVGDVIEISEFSNRYGPIDKMEKGDRYVVFLNRRDKSDQVLSYYVQSPTSGDLKVKGKNVQYDLTSTTFHQNQHFHSLKQFEEFLEAYYDRKKAPKLISQLRPRLLSDADPEVVAQHLMKLYFLGFDEFEEVYDEFADYGSVTTKYALAQLLGNVRNDQSREVLFKLLKDDSSLVQGEAVRQLKKEPIEIVGPLLVEHLKTASSRNYGPINLMDPVMNRSDGGKNEIIRALGEMRYKAAVPALLPLLNTNDPDQFKLVVESLKAIGSKEYIPYFNSNLLQKNEELASTIATFIVSDSLNECLPSLKYFISNCNRNSRRDQSWMITNLSALKSSDIKNFLLFDYQRFQTYADTLESRKQLKWNAAYIESFTRLKTKEARPYIYASIYDWMGISPDFVRNPALFDLKKSEERALSEKFNSLPDFKNYKLSHDIAFIRESEESTGKKVAVYHMIEVVIPSEEEPKSARQRIAKLLEIAPKNVYIRFDSGAYYNESQDRFDEKRPNNPANLFIEYAKAIPNQKDAAFLQALIDNGYISEPYYKERALDAIKSIKVALP